MVNIRERVREGDEINLGDIVYCGNEIYFCCRVINSCINILINLIKVFLFWVFRFYFCFF